MSATAVLSQLVFSALIAGFAIATIAAALVALFFRNVVLGEESNGKPAYALQSLKIGGLGMSAAFLIGISLIQILGETTPIKSRNFWGFLLSLLIIAAVLMYDTLRTQDWRVRIGGMVLAALVAMGGGIVIDQFHLPGIGWILGGWWIYPLTLFWILGLTSTYDAMQGVEGLAVSNAVIASAFLSYISFQQESVFIYLCSLALLSASVGFLVFNWSSEKCILGEIGSVFLGFSFAVMAIIAARYDRSHTSLLVIPLLLFHFIFDSAFTCTRRILRGESPFSGKIPFLHQLLGSSGCSRRAIMAWYAAMAMVQGLGAIAMINIPGSNRVWVFAPFLLFQGLYALWVMNRAGRKQQGEAVPIS